MVHLQNALPFTNISTSILLYAIPMNLCNMNESVAVKWKRSIQKSIYHVTSSSEFT